MFDKDSFLQATFTEALDTRVAPVPVGEYPAQIVDIKPKTGTIGKGERAGEVWAGLDVIWEISDPNLAATLKRAKVTVKQNVFLDLTPTGMLDLSPGANISFGRLRDAVGLNTPGQPFSPGMLLGRSARIAVTQRPDDNDASIIYNDVGKVAKQ